MFIIQQFIDGYRNMLLFCIKFGRKKNKQAYYKWHIDETYIKIKGQWNYLYRAIDADGHTLDISLRKKRDNHSAYTFIKRLIKQFGKPQMIITDQAPSTKVAMSKVIKDFKTYPQLSLYL
ncbi:IS431 transposase [Staphylococcus aureus]|nr:IS431 transposase [Staphylococcus aureus]